MPSESAKPAGPMAYVVLWFPKPSETFIFREVKSLREKGVDVEAYAVYGPIRRHMTDEMRNYDGPVCRLGIFGAWRMPLNILYWLFRRPGASLKALKNIIFRRWRSLEMTAESWISGFYGFTLATWFKKRGIKLIHADWACGPATAAWVASMLTDIPFSFTGRAGDIFPNDGALTEKGRDALFIRTDVGSNVPYFQSQGIDPAKIHLIYASLTLKKSHQVPLPFAKPYQITALGRFVITKGYDWLIRACALLRDQGLDFRLNLVGSGPLEGKLKALTKELDLEEIVLFPGFITHDQVGELFNKTDVFTMPSQVSPTGDRDGIPNVIMEAMSHRLPVVATDVSGISEVVRDGETGYLVPEKNPEALADALGRMLSDRDKALEMAENGHKLVLAMFDPATIMAQLHDMFVERMAGVE